MPITQMEYTHTRRQDCHKSPKIMTNMESLINTSPTQRVLKVDMSEPTDKNTRIVSHSHKPRVDISQNQWAKRPNSTPSSQMALTITRTSEPTGRNAQRTLSAHKQASASDTRPNQLAESPDSAWCSRETLARSTPADLLGLGARQLVQRRLSIPPRISSRPAGSQCPAWKKQGESLNRFQPLLGMSPQLLLLGSANHEQGASHSRPRASWWQRLYWGKLPGARYQESLTSRWEPSSVSEVGPGGYKANKEAGLVERKACFIFLLFTLY